MSKRKQFLESVHHEHVQDFLDFIRLHKDGADPFDLAEVLPELQRSQRQELWERQLKLLQHSLTAHPPERWITGAEEDAGDMEVEISEEQKGYMCTPHVLALLTEVAQGCLSHKAETQEDQSSLTIRILTNIFQKVVEIIAHRLRKDKEEGQELCCSSEEALYDFLLVTKFTTERSEFITGVFSSLSAAVIIDISRTLQKISHVEEMLTPETVNDLPPLSNTILKVTLKSPAVTMFFLSEISSSIESEVIDSITQWAAVTHILTIIKQSDAFIVELKEIALSVRRQIQRHYNITAENSANIQRSIYESTVRMLNDILNPCQQPNS
uniref:Condensin-2 complex subunit G2-like n=1 Tax=Sinocyclocheilus anshuiensis TaxID=1608454 RepID=A0A671NME9_9TELE